MALPMSNKYSIELFTELDICYSGDVALENWFGFFFFSFLVYFYSRYLLNVHLTNENYVMIMKTTLYLKSTFIKTSVLFSPYFWKAKTWAVFARLEKDGYACSSLWALIDQVLRLKILFLRQKHHCLSPVAETDWQETSGSS